MFKSALLATTVLAASYAANARAEFVLQLPLGAKETYSRLETSMEPQVPIKPWDGAAVPTVRGPERIRRSTWAFGGEQTLSDVQGNILGQLESSDYEIIMFCQTQECGGFDFRFNINVVNEPDMRVDLRDFRFVTARQTTTQTPAYVTFLLSKSPVSVYVQMTEYSAKPQAAVNVEIETSAEDQNGADPQSSAEFGESIVLEGLIFASGSAQLTDDPEGVIAVLAKSLMDDEALQVLLVGHSDMTGSLRANMTLSERRAETIMKLLQTEYGISKSRLSAHGVGYLSPRASNETDTGKEKNRRIEAVLFR